jgi:hypothetical protein
MALQIKPVSGRRELDRFIKLPWQLYRDEPAWVPPLLMDVRKRLDQKRNPFFKHAQAQYFLAYRDGKPVGRISAHIDHSFNAFQQNEWGLFGWFECEDDPEAARGLLDAAAGWLRDRGRDRMVGPMDFTTNDEIGLLIAGHEHRPIVLCPWHQPYYQRLVEQDAGMEKAMDLFMWSLHVTGRDKVHPTIWQAAGKLESDHGIICRNFRKRNLHNEVTRFLEVYNAAWENNWAAVPLSEEEVRHYAKDLKPVLDENWAMVAEKRDTGEVVGAALTLPDFNQVLAKLNGRLLPFGWITALREKRRSTLCACSRSASSPPTSTPESPHAFTNYADVGIIGIRPTFGLCRSSCGVVVVWCCLRGWGRHNAGGLDGLSGSWLSWGLVLEVL